jgi:threonine/homoserine/homoserine lactone efflux protein
MLSQNLASTCIKPALLWLFLMDLQHYGLFVCASIILCVVPGPDMIYLLSRSIAQGRKAGVAAAVGINLGGYVHLLAAILGISAVIATSSVAFAVLKWCGAIYLIYIGLKALLSKESSMIEKNEGSSEEFKFKTIFWQGFISDVLNPKVAIFFISILPQFIQPDAGNSLTQLLVLGLTVNMIALPINLLFVLFAYVVTSNLRQNAGLSLTLNKIMGGVFIGLGLRLANEQR